MGEAETVEGTDENHLLDFFATDVDATDKVGEVAEVAVRVALVEEAAEALLREIADVHESGTDPVVLAVVAVVRFVDAEGEDADAPATRLVEVDVFGVEAVLVADDGGEELSGDNTL